MKFKSKLPHIVITTTFLVLGAAWLSSSSSKSKRELIILDMVGKNPGESRYISSFNDPRKLKNYGYNGQVFRDFVSGGVTFDSLDQAIFPAGSGSRKWVEETAARIDEQIKKAKDEGIKVYYFTDIIILPKKVKQLYKDQICDDKGNISFHKPKTQEIHRIMIDEIFTRFPDIDGLVIRTGENYVYDLPHHVGNTPMDISNPLHSHIELINFLREEVCVKRKKDIIYRTWSADNFHYDPNYYLSVTDAVVPHSKLVFSIKHTSGDFHRNEPFNPTLGLGNHKQIVEIQCQREFEGKGAYPNYIGDGVLNGFEEFSTVKKKFKRLLLTQANSLNDIKDNPNFAGVWTWSRGGGWYGPYIKNELWTDINAYVFSAWANNPELSEEEIFKQYCKRILGMDNKSIAKFRELSLLSAQAIVRGRNSLQYPVNVWWTRDDFLGGIDQLEETFRWAVEHDKVDEVLEEKEESVRMWEKIVSLSEDIKVKDLELSQTILSSSQYGRVKYGIIHQAWIIMLKGYQGDVTGYYDHEVIREAIIRYDRYWDEFYNLSDTNSATASLYRPYTFVAPLANGTMNESKLNNGMKNSIDKYRGIVDAI